MAVLYNMRAIAQSNSEYVFWTDSEPDLDGSNAPETVVLDSITILSTSGSSDSGDGYEIIPSAFGMTFSEQATNPNGLKPFRLSQSFYDGTYVWLGGPFYRINPNSPLTSLEGLQYKTSTNSLQDEGPGQYSSLADLSNFPFDSAWYQAGDRIYIAGGRGHPDGVDDTFAANAAVDRIWSAPVSNLLDLTLEADVLPSVKRFASAIKNDTHIFILGSETGTIFRAPISNPTQFTLVGTQTFGGATSHIAVYQTDTTAYCIAANAINTNRSIWSSPITDLVNWSLTGATFPGVAARDQIFRCGDLFFYRENALTNVLYYATIYEPTVWRSFLAFTTMGTEMPVVVLDSGIYFYGGIVSAVASQRVWYLTNTVKVKRPTGYGRMGNCRNIIDNQ